MSEPDALIPDALLPDALIAVARIARPQGRRGEVRVAPLTDTPERLGALGDCYLVPPAAGEPCHVDGVWFQGATPVVKLRGVETITAAAGLAGRLLSIPRSQVRPLPPDRYYGFDLAGCAVRTPEGALVGRLEEVLAGPEHDTWVVRDGPREHLIPAVSAIVERVDVAGRVVVIRPPDGLLELDA